MGHELKVSALVALLLLTGGLASASVVRFEADFWLTGRTARGDICPIPSACASGFETDTGLQLGPFWQITGFYRFNYDTDRDEILPGGLLSLRDSFGSTFTQGGMSVLEAGSPTIEYKRAIELWFSGNGFSTPRTWYCGEDVESAPPLTLAYAATTQPGAFPFDSCISSLVDGQTTFSSPSSTTWLVPTRFGVIAPVPAPGTLALLSLGLLGVGLMRSRTTGTTTGKGVP